jgi:hypothetical protein
MILLFVVWGFLILGGFYLQRKYKNSRYINYLYFPRSHKMEAIFRFQFSRNPTELEKMRFAHSLVSLEVYGSKRITPAHSFDESGASMVSLFSHQAVNSKQ